MRQSGGDDVHLLLTSEEAANLLAVVASARAMIADGVPMPGLARTQRSARVLDTVADIEGKLRVIVAATRLRP